MEDTPLTPVDVEICIKSSSRAKPSDIRDHARQVLENAYRGRSYAPGSVTELLKTAGGPLLKENVKSARICEIVNANAVAAGLSGEKVRTSVYLPSIYCWMSQLRLFTYQLNDDGPSSESAPQGEEAGGESGGEAEVLSQYTQWNLPATEFEGVWEALLYDDDGDGEGQDSSLGPPSPGGQGFGPTAKGPGSHGHGQGSVSAGSGAAAMAVDAESSTGKRPRDDASAADDDEEQGAGSSKRQSTGNRGTGDPAGASGKAKSKGQGEGSKGQQAKEDGSLSGSRLKPALLSYASSAMLFSDAGVNSSLIAWNHVVLLHGPPGTGKTSLCKALAHKLAIRLGGRYPTAQLIEINAHSLFSRWFSESGKLVHRLFGHIRELCEDEDCLVVLLIDEVESLTAARKAAVSGSEPSDAVRVVNAVLTAIDSFRTRKNVLLLTTSNVSEAIDVAFVDRADIKAYVGPPGTKARYDILASCVQELTRVGIVRLGRGSGSGATADGADGNGSRDSSVAMSDSPMTGGHAGGAGAGFTAARLADGHEAALLVQQAGQAGATTGAGSVSPAAADMASPAAGESSSSSSTAPIDVATSLLVWQAAAAASGFSGRTLRKLPLQAHAMFVRSTPGSPCSGQDFGRALLRAVRAEKAARTDFADLG